MRKKLIKSIEDRLEEEITSRSTLKYLKELDVNDYIDNVISTLYLYTRVNKRRRNTIYLVEVLAAIGHNLRNKYKLKRDSAKAVRTGAFLLYSFQELGILEAVLGQGKKQHATYIIQVLDDDTICELWNGVKTSKVEKLPSELPYEPWTSSKHSTGAYLIKTGNRDVIQQISPETHPIIFNGVNKAQSVGWTINDYIFDVHRWGLRNKTRAFSDIWDLHNREARATKLREAKAIGSIAKRFLGKTFYHLYYYDFRGRRYPATAYLHEQGSDLARGLLRRADSKRLGEDGYFWLMVTISTRWGGESGREDGLKTDKLPLKERYDWAIDNEEIFLSYAENPKVNQGWMEADKPWQFLAACKELMDLRKWQYDNGMENTLKYPDKSPWDCYDYESHMEAYIDGSNNGSQHLSALTLDEKTAPYVNLVPQPLPGDLYEYVAEHVWATLEEEIKEYTKEEIEDCERLIDTMIDLKKRISECEPKSERRIELIEEVRKFKEDNTLLIQIAAPVYWLRIKDLKGRRKIVKRNVMTLPYGGTAYGLGQQQIDDAKKHNINLLMHMEHRWGAYLGREIYKDCKTSLERPMRLLKIFEQAGKKAEQAGKFLSWEVPVTKFPVVQNYTEGKVRKLWIQYGPPLGERSPSSKYFKNTLQLHVCFIEDVKPSKGKQSQGASPNAIHSLDAAHLAMIVDEAPFPVSCIHDSFGCLLADMPQLFHIVRETFVKLYKTDPLSSIMNQIGGDISEIEFGTLDINDILTSEFCFA